MLNLWTGIQSVGRSFIRDRRLLRVKFDDQAFVDVLAEFRTVRRTLERAGRLLHVDIDPRGEADLFGELQRILDPQLTLGLLGSRDDVARLDERR
jgi:hypothetical protein